MNTIMPKRLENIFNKIVNKVKYTAPILYIPESLQETKNQLEIVSAWKGHDLILADIINRFDIPKKKCLEFGVEFGFSAVAMSSFFEEVTGVDIFVGDIHTTHKGDHFAATKERLKPFSNINLIKADYQDFIKNNDDIYDLIHVDIVHTYEHTYKCGLWAAQHSKCTIFHDTESFPMVKRAVYDIAEVTNKKFYNYPKYFGLGIIV
jgi:predicted O-methyltransferase YrrM